MFRPISVGMAPTIQSDDLARAFRALLAPWKWEKGDDVEKLRHWFKRRFSTEFAIPFNSGRAALYGILKAMKLGTGDEVLLQAFTCVAVPNAVLWVGATPVYVDTVEHGYSMSVSDLEKKITPKTKAIIVQHTFGYPDDMERIVKIAKKHNLYLIEDCAHSLGNELNGKRLGTYGDAAFFSFGRDKVVSSTFGGVAIASDKAIGTALEEQYKTLHYPTGSWIVKQLLYPLFMAMILPWYGIQIGKVILEVLKKVQLLSLPVDSVEYYCEHPTIYPKRLPNALAGLALRQLYKLESFQQKRVHAAQLYRKHLNHISIGLPPETSEPLIRFSIHVEDPHGLYYWAKKKNIILGNWYSNVIDPKGVDMNRVGYKKGTCPNAEYHAPTIINLPSAPVLEEKEIMKVIETVKGYYEH